MNRQPNSVGSSAWQGLRELSGRHVRLLPLMVLVSLLAFSFEGLAIYLIFPLIEIIAGNDIAGVGEGPLGWLGSMVAMLPENRQLSAVVLVIVACILLKSILSFITTVVFSNATQRIGDDIRRSSFAQILSASPLFLASRPAGVMVNTLSNQTWAVSQGLEKVALLFTNASAVVVFLVLLVSVSWTSTLSILVGVALAVVAMILINRVITRMGRKAVQANEQLTVKMLEGISGQETLRLFNSEQHANREFASSSRQTRSTLHKLSIVSALPPLLLEVLFAAVIGFVLVVLRKGNVSETLVLIALLFRMQPHAVALVHARSVLFSITGAVENLEGLRHAAAATSEISGLPTVPSIKNNITLSEVGFSYPQPDDDVEASLPALENVTFDIPAGQVTAIVGHSGAGKSTIAMLLCRLAEPDHGKILIDGKALADYDAGSWRDRCAFVPQSVFLFNQSVKDNIQLGSLSATTSQIEKAAIEAHAHDFIGALPQGYDTVVGDRGENLSGGQRQRIALARALLRDPDLLILDEATNSLDPKSERLVSDALNANTGGRTVVVIAHRLLTIQSADNVVVLERGSVVESGAYAQLVNSGGHFAKLFESEIVREQL